MNFLDMLSLIGSLALIVVILVLTYFGTRWYARRMGQTGAGRYIKVLERTGLGTGSSVAIVQVGEVYYLLGIGDKQVRLIAQLPDFEAHVQAVSQKTQQQPFSQMFRQIVDKTREKANKKDDGDRQ